MIPEIVYSEAESSHPAHTHVHYEMLYVQEGRISMNILGHDYPVKAGDILFLNQFEEHASVLMEAPYKRYYVLIPPKSLRALPHDPELLSVFRFHGGNFPYVLSTGECKPRFDFYFSLLHEAAQHPGNYQEARLEALITLILTEAQALSPAMFPPQRESALLPMQEILDQLDQHFDQPFSLAQLARAFHVSPGCLTLHFRQYVGMSPMQYVTQSRLTHAKRLLIKSDLPVQAIALQCGFGDVSNFSRRFREQFSYTPLQFRRAYRPK